MRQTDINGRWRIAGLPAGRVRITVNAPGFQSAAREVEQDAERGVNVAVGLLVGSVNEQIMVTANAPVVKLESQQSQRNLRQNAAAEDNSASTNVADLQRRVVGVLPIAMNVPRTGNSYRFVRPLIVDEETRLTFSYRSR